MVHLVNIVTYVSSATIHKYDFLKNIFMSRLDCLKGHFRYISEDIFSCLIK